MPDSHCAEYHASTKREIQCGIAGDPSSKALHNAKAMDDDLASEMTAVDSR